MGVSAAEERQTCVARAPSFDRDGLGYELIDARKREVWATTDWTPAAYEEFRLPFTKRTWRKNDPRIGLADESRFHRSPSCDREGQFTYLDAYDREFLQVVKLKSVDRQHAKSLNFVVVELEKYHSLTYKAGRTLPVIEDDGGRQYLAVTRAANEPETDRLDLPPGWTHTEWRLEEDLDLALHGDVTVIRVSNGYSFQGPLPMGMSATPVENAE